MFSMIVAAQWSGTPQQTENMHQIQ